MNCNMIIQPEISTCSIVLVGHFNPAIFHPAWFEAMDIEPNNSQVDNNSNFSFLNKIAQFTIDTRRYNIQENRFQIETTTAPWVSILDLTVKTFKEHLVHTPINAFGVNRTVHFKLSDYQSLLRLGRKLAPIEPWDDFGREMEAEDISLTGGLLSLKMQKRSLNEGNYWETNVTIEPSKILQSNSGVYMEVNSHHPLRQLPEGYGSEQGIEMLLNCFEESVNEADLIIEGIMKKGLTQ